MRCKVLDPSTTRHLLHTPTTRLLFCTFSAISCLTLTFKLSHLLLYLSPSLSHLCMLLHCMFLFFSWCYLTFPFASSEILIPVSNTFNLHSILKKCSIIITNSILLLNLCYCLSLFTLAHNFLYLINKTYSIF